MRIDMTRSFTIVALTALLGGPAIGAPQAFQTPGAAVNAVVAALEAGDRSALLDVFGSENEDVVFSGDPERDRQDWSDFLAAYKEMNRVSEEGETATLYIGHDQWPMPIPIVKGDGGQWQFDAEAGSDEITARRIGENELDVIELLRAYVRVQAAYRQIDYDGDGVMEFANAILSDDGARNGLYWPQEPGMPQSPIGDFIARASAEGYNVDGEASEPEPYLGYYFQILQRQGPNAPGGERPYTVNNDMVSGHAILAFPSAYGDTGIMTLMVGENGVVYEADLGEDTLERAAAIDAYDPSDDWIVVE
ncbi:MAG: DUF2950 domain-containing protein [Acuticoccus sp.]